MDTIISPSEQFLHLIASHKRKKITAESLASEVNEKHFVVDEKKLEKTHYKASVFNYHLEIAEGVLIYNTLYNTLVRLNKREYSQYRRGSCYSLKLKKQLVLNGIWVEEKLDEKKIFLRMGACHTLHLKRPLSITITTTLKCNAHCPYCYERGVMKCDMPCENVESIIQFIKSQHPEYGLHITWFGGEPLMNTQFIDEVCEKLVVEDIKFESYIITNGSLFTEDMIQNRKDKWKLQNVQITLDGTCAVYETTKSYDDPALHGYDSVLKIIRMLAANGINTHIRMNICRENSADIQELVKELGREFVNEDKVDFYPAFLTGIQNQLDEDERIACIREMFENVSKPQKLTSGSKFYSMPRSRACNNSDPRAFVIDVSGNIFTCEHLVGIAEKAIGNIQSPEKLHETRDAQPRIAKKCMECFFLPKCFGGCQAHRDSGDNPCFIEKYMLQAYLSLL